jgi:hypothetical protein
MNAIDPGRLSKTVFEAVAITRGLGLKYLWVDTLCIIQDDIEDWKCESATMDLVYRHALVMIAASSAKDGREGCFLESTSSLAPVRVPLNVTTSQEMTSITFKIHSGSIAEGFEDSPLCQRGWCLQESTLSKRILHFRKDRVIWQCKECLTAEDYIDLRWEPDAASNFDRTRRFSKLPVTPSLNDWLNIVEDYSRRRLTVYKDKLYAMQGLANFFKPALGGTYLAGMWLSGIHHCLLWISATGEMQEPPSSRAPSWSWAALDGPIYHLQTLRSLEVSHQSIIQILRFGNFEVSSGAAQLGKSKFAGESFIVCAPLCRIYRSDSTIRASDFNIIALETLHDLLYERRDMQCHELLDSQGESCGWVSFDQESFVQEDMHCLLVSTIFSETKFQAHNVMIVRDAGEEDSFTFKRMGVGEITRENFFEGLRANPIILM